MEERVKEGGIPKYYSLGLYPLETPGFPTGDRRFLSKTRLPCRYKHVLYSVLSPRSLITSRWLGQRPRFSTSQALPFPLSGQGSTTSTTRHNSPGSQNWSFKSSLFPRNLKPVRLITTAPGLRPMNMLMREPQPGQTTYDLPTGTFSSGRLSSIQHFEQVTST
jgi:hypothetical protein